MLTMNSRLATSLLMMGIISLLSISLVTYNEGEATHPHIVKSVIDDDSDDSGCESGGSPASEWCPDNNKNAFNITDTEVEDTSFVFVQLDGQAENSGCNVIDIGEDWFIVFCAQAVTDDVELYYMIVE